MSAKFGVRPLSENHVGATANLKMLTPAEFATLEDNPKTVEDFLFPEGVENPFEGQTDLDKSWHSLHYLLTGAVGPDGTAAGDAILGGSAIGPNLGYGQARLITAVRANEIFRALSDLNFTGRYDSFDPLCSEVNRVYLGASIAVGRASLEHFFRLLKDFYARASSTGSAVLAYMA